MPDGHGLGWKHFEERPYAKVSHYKLYKPGLGDYDLSKQKVKQRGRNASIDFETSD